MTAHENYLATDTGRNGTNGTNMKRPHLLFAATAASGHFYPMLRIAEEMVQRGFELTFIAGEDYEGSVKRLGADYVPIPMALPPPLLEELSKIPSGMPALLWITTHLFTLPLPRLHKTLSDTLAKIRSERPDTPIIIMHEHLYMGALPFRYGAPLPKGFDVLPPIVGISITPLISSSIDLGPFGTCLPPDSTPSGRARNVLITKMLAAGPGKMVLEPFREMMRSIGANDPFGADSESLFTTNFNSYETLLQMCSPSLEYPRSDLHPSNIFAGCLPPKEPRADQVYPEWWSDITERRKKVVAVAQGTVAINLEELTLPTLRALAGRDDVFVVAVLGVKGATVPAGFEVPANARIVDFVPYDALLRHVDVWVQNAGYGGVLHGVMNGVPCVLAGESEDKAETALRMEYAGIAVNLKTARPTPEQIRQGVDEVLRNGSYKKRVLEIKKENEQMRPLDLIEKFIWEKTGKAQGHVDGMPTKL